MITTSKFSDQVLDAAAGEALGANSPADSAAWQQQLATGGAPVNGLDRELRETVARLSAASPYMATHSDLRAKILQATAPQTFRMEDYRHANRDTGRFFRWGFAAAMLFLAAGAWYNMTLQSQLKATVASANAQLDVRNVAISDLISPKAKQVALVQNSKVYAKAFVNDATKTAVLLVPEGLMPAGKTINEITLTNDENKPVVYRTIAITTSRAAFPQVAAGDTLNVELKAQNIQPDPNQRAYTAQMNH
jgi:hypothetical protein